MTHSVEYSLARATIPLLCREECKIDDQERGGGFSRNGKRNVGRCATRHWRWLERTPRSFVTKFHATHIDHAQHATWSPSVSDIYIIHACVCTARIFACNFIIPARDRGRSAAEYQKHTSRNGYNLSAVWETRIYRRHKIARNEKKQKTTVSLSLSSTGGGGGGDSRRSLKFSRPGGIFRRFRRRRCRRYRSNVCTSGCFRWKSSNEGEMLARYVAQFFTRSVATTYPRARARAFENVFLSSLGGRVLLHFIRETFAEHGNAIFANPLLRFTKAIGDATGGEKEGWINYRRLESRSLSPQRKLGRIG